MYNLPTTVDPNKIFLINRSELEGRIDAAYIAQKLKTKRKYNYPTEKLNKLVRSLTGGTPSKEKPEYWDGDIYWVSPKDFKQFYINKSEDTITELGLNNSSTKLIPANSILIVVRSGVLIHTLPVAINTIPVTINQDIKALIPTNKILPEYLGYYFNVFNSAILPLIVKHSTTVQSVNTNEFDRLEIPVPPIKDQQLIVNILNCALSAKQQKEAEAKALLESIDTYLLGKLGISLPEQDNSLEKRIFIMKHSEIGSGRIDPDYHTNYYKKLRKAIYNSNIGCVNLNSITSVLKSGKTPSSSQYSDGQNEFPIIKVGSYTGSFIDLEKVDYVQEKQYIKAQKGDIFILSAAHQSEYVGRHIKYLQIDPVIDTSYVGELICVRASQKCNSMYLFSLLSLNIYKTLINREKTGQTSHVYGKDLKIIPIPLPSVEKQSEIANHIQNIRSQAKVLQHEAAMVLEEAKREVEKMILGE